MRFFRVLGVPLVEVYGLTESTGMVTGHKLDDVQVGTVGVPTSGVELRIAKGSDDDLGGEFQIKGDMVFAGYYKNPEATAQSIVDGWLHTGDVVRLVDGQIKIVDRLKDIMITAGGKNLTPSEIENTMKASPYIKECIVVAEGRHLPGGRAAAAAMDPRELLYWGVMSLAITVGFFTAYPMNWWLVSKGLKHGLMTVHEPADTSGHGGMAMPGHAGHMA